MTLPTVTISIAAATSSGTIPDDAVVTFELDGADVDVLSGEIVIPDRTSVTLVNGVGTINKWPNGRGTQSTQYIVTIEGTSYRIAKRVTVPDANCDLYTLMQFATLAPDAASAAEIAAQGYAADARNAAETSVATAATATPTSSDTVLGVQGGVVKRFAASDLVLAETYGGKTVHFVAGVIRNTGTIGSPNWVYIDDANHTKMNLATVAVTSGGKLRIMYSATYGKVLSLVACPDETMAAQGFRCGASVAADLSLIDIAAEMKGYVNLSTGVVTTRPHWGSRITAAVNASTGVVTVTHPESNGDLPEAWLYTSTRVNDVVAAYVNSTTATFTPYAQLSGYVTYGGASWAVTSPNSGVSVAESGGVVTITHPVMPATAYPQVSARYGPYVAMPDSAGDTTFTVKFKDMATGADVTTPDTSMRFFFGRPFPAPMNAAAVGAIGFNLGWAAVHPDDFAVAGTNIWVIGVFEDA